MCFLFESPLSQHPTLEFWKDLAAIAQSVTIVAVASGGAWLYLKRRQRFPRASIKHSIDHRRMTDGRILLRVVVTLANLGEVLIVPKKGLTWVQQIKPRDDEYLSEYSKTKAEVLQGCNIQWPLIEQKDADLSGPVDIEPQEEQEFCFEFLLDGEIETISVYSHFENEKKPKSQLGWNKTSLYDLTREDKTNGE